VLKAIQHNIAIYSAHTSMDSWLHGVSGKMADKLGVTEYRILSENQDNVGLGVIGQLSEPMGMQAFMAHVAKVFGIEGAGLRYVEGKGKQVQKIAICGGAGADLVNEAIAQSADVYVSADFKYHEMQAAAGQIAVVDMDHWVSEHFTREIFEQLLSPYIHTHVAKTDKSPVQYWG
jgi:putative NIF3 family GTP cyclohydrolase 1 type 2